MVNVGRRVLLLLVVALMAVMLMAVAATPGLTRAISDNACSPGNAEQSPNVGTTTDGDLRQCSVFPGKVEGKGKQKGCPEEVPC
jgi:hypothetical protein